MTIEAAIHDKAIQFAAMPLKCAPPLEADTRRPP